MQDYRRFIVIILGLVIMAVAWWWQSEPRIEPVTSAEQIALPKPRNLVLVAANHLDAGSVISEAQAEWTIADDSNSPSGAILKPENTETPNPYIGRLVLKSLDKGEAILPVHLASADNANYVAQLLQPGKRAYAIAIDSKGTVTAGNFVLPNDRVDIIRSFNSGSGLQSEAILSNIRVLAIGQSVRGEGLSSSGETATVEVELYEAELLATAQRTGQISLALRKGSETNSVRPANLLIIRPTVTAEKSP